MKRSSQIIHRLGLVCLFLMSASTQAHTWSGRLSSASDSLASYSVACYNDGNGETDRLFFDVQGKTSAAVYRIQISAQKKMANGEIITAGPVVDQDNTDTRPSPPSALYGGNGTYILNIAKTPRQAGGSTTGPMVFSFDFHCEAASGAHTGTQEQPTLLTKPVDPVDPVDPDPVEPTQPKNPLVSSFSGSLGALATEKRYAMACSAKSNKATARYWFSIRGVTKNRPFRVQLKAAKDGAEKTVDDPTNNDAAFGGWGYLDGGDGPYTLTIGKISDMESIRGSMAFKVRHSCEAADGTRTKMSKPKVLK